MTDENDNACPQATLTCEDEKRKNPVGFYTKFWTEQLEKLKSLLEKKEE